MKGQDILILSCPSREDKCHITFCSCSVYSGSTIILWKECMTYKLEHSVTQFARKSILLKFLTDTQSLVFNKSSGFLNVVPHWILNFKKVLYEGHTSQNIADICINSAPTDSLKKTSAEQKIIYL
jgi:hypothetical protein